MQPQTLVARAAPLAVGGALGIAAATRRGTGLDDWRAVAVAAFAAGIAVATLVALARTVTYAVRTRLLHRIELYWKRRPPLLPPSLEIALVELLFLAVAPTGAGAPAFFLGAGLAAVAWHASRYVLHPLAQSCFRWINRPEAVREALVRAGQRHATDDSVDGLLIRAVVEMSGGSQAEAQALLREALARPELVGEARGIAAAHLAWTLVEDDPDPSTFAEIVEQTAIAKELAPEFRATVCVRAWLACVQGHLDEAVATSTWGLRLTFSDGGHAQLLCIRAVAHARLGDTAQAARDHAKAARLWPGCDMLAWAERELGSLPR